MGFIVSNFVLRSMYSGRGFFWYGLLHMSVLSEKDGVGMVGLLTCAHSFLCIIQR
jgi:hypothetical protein